jgi:flagellar assembly protein FliH
MKHVFPVNGKIKNIELNTTLENHSDLGIDPNDWELISQMDDQIFTKLRNRIFSLESALQTVREESFRAGFQEGKKTAEDEFRGTLEKYKTEFQQITESLDEQFLEAIKKMEIPILRLSIKIARKIIGDQIKQSNAQNKFLKTQIERFLNVIISQGKIVIFVNPEQLAWISQEEHKSEKSFEGNIVFKSNTNLKSGECLLETEDYIIDGTIDGQLDRIEKQLFSQYDVKQPE